MTRDAIRAALVCARSQCPCKTARGLVHCPYHAPALDDAKPNLQVNISEKSGNTLVHCFSGCSWEHVRDELITRGLWDDDRRNGTGNNLPPKRQPKRRGTLVATYTYRDHDGKPRWEKGRFEQDGDKDFAWRPLHGHGWEGRGGTGVDQDALWCGNDESITEALARRPDDDVWICEGEKATLAAIEAGLLACCGGWGASQKTFGHAFEALTGRRVRMWADNDAPGADYAMRVRVELRGLNIEVTPVFVQVPSGGDAADYFADGGTVEVLLTATPAEWIVRQTGAAAFQAFGPTGQAPARFEFEDLTAGRGYRGATLDTRITARLEPPGLPSSRVWTGRGNISSLSGRREIIRELGEYFGKDHDWGSVIIEMFSRIEDAWRGLDRSIDQADIPDPGPLRWLMPALLVDGTHNLWFAPGKSLKTMLAIGIAAALAYGEDFLGHIGPPTTIMYVDYETTQEIWTRRVDRILAGFPYFSEHNRIRYWAPRGESLGAQIGGLQRAIRQHNIGLVIVDSAQWAAGGKTDDGAAAMQYFNDLSKLGGCATLTLAHVTADVVTEGRIPEKPSGVMTWRDAPRLVHYIRRDEDEGGRWAQDAPVAFIPRKVNEGGTVPETIAIVRFDDSDGYTGPVTFELRDSAEEFAGIAEALEPFSRIKDLLEQSDAANGWSITEIGEELNIKSNTVAGVLRRNQDQFDLVSGGGQGSRARYRLAGSQPEMFGE